MANYAEEPLTKITVNLFKRDVDWFLEKYPQGWTKKLREAIRKHVDSQKDRCQHGLERDLCGQCSIHLEMK